MKKLSLINFYVSLPFVICVHLANQIDRKVRLCHEFDNSSWKYVEMTEQTERIMKLLDASQNDF